MKHSTKRKVKSAFWQMGYCLGSAAVAAAVMYLIWPYWLFVLSLSQIVLHEFGHYFAALFQHAPVMLPYFISLGFITLGATPGPATLHTPRQGMIIALAGPLVAIAFLIGAAIFFFNTGFLPGVSAALIFLAYQIYGATLGSDGRKFRKFRRQWRAERIRNTSRNFSSAPAYA